MMLILALAAASAGAAAEPPRQRPTAPLVQAHATVTVVRGVRVTFGETIDAAQLRTSTVRDYDGNPQQARLIEFE